MNYYVIKIAYDGSKFFGFQRLKGKESVQKHLEDALTKINKSEVLVKGAGRTDRGVHANGQCVSFSLNVNIDCNHLKMALNSLLKPYIYVKECYVVDKSFHARFYVKKKTYIYKINLGEYNPLLTDYVYQPEYKLDIQKMKDVAKMFLGVHNFHNFVSGTRDNYNCVIYNISFEMDKDTLNIIFIGKSFYRYMVRNLVGAMIDVGRGKISFEVVKEMLETEDDISLLTAPACGLYLENVEY